MTAIHSVAWVHHVLLLEIHQDLAADIKLCTKYHKMILKQIKQANYGTLIPYVYFSKKFNLEQFVR